MSGSVLGQPWHSYVVLPARLTLSCGDSEVSFFLVFGPRNVFESRPGLIGTRTVLLTWELIFKKITACRNIDNFKKKLVVVKKNRKTCMHNCLSYHFFTVCRQVCHGK